MPDIIIVEDNKEIGTLLCDFLRKENYTVSLADTGEKALSIFEQYFWCLISVCPDLTDFQSVRRSAKPPTHISLSRVRKQTRKRLSTQMRWLSIKMNKEAAHAARM